MEQKQVASSLLAWRTATVALLFGGYAGYYFCRVILSATAPLLIADFHAHGMSVAAATLQIGALASFGTLAYAFGKLFLTWSGDFFGGKRTFLLGMLGAIAFTVLFANARSVPIFMLAWIGNRLSQSIGWAGLVKVSSSWFPYSLYGGVMAVLSLSYLVGDAVTRSGAGALIAGGFGWRSIFMIASAALAILLLLNLALLRDSSEAAGFSPPAINPLNVFGPAGTRQRPQDLRMLLQPLLRSRTFWIVCGLSFGTTLLREALGTWTPLFLTAGAGFAVARAVTLTALPPIAGVCSVLLAGWLSDRLGSGGRGLVTCAGLALAACALLWVGLLPKGSGLLAVALIVAVAFFYTGPYSYLGGAMALDFGGRTGSASASGIIDGVGYLGGALAGAGVAHVVLASGWSAAFFSLAAVTGATAVLAIFITPWCIDKGSVAGAP